jgi:hypothetical protein
MDRAGISDWLAEAAARGSAPAVAAMVTLQGGRTLQEQAPAGTATAP